MSRWIVITAGILLASPAWAGTVAVSNRDCAGLVTEHVADADVAFRPGVDARGRKVAPADLNGGYAQIQAPREIEFDVSVDLRNFLGGPAADAQAQSAATAAADSAAAAATAAETAAQSAEGAALADPTNSALAAAADSARTGADAAAAAVTAKDKSAAASQSAAAAAAASAADPGNAPLAAVAASAQTASASASAANLSMTKAFAEAARIGQFIGRPVVGRVKVRGHQVYFNGQLIGDAARHAVIEACRKRTAKAD